MKSPDRWRTGIPPSAENGSKGPGLAISRYGKPTIEVAPTTFHTVSEEKFSEVRIYILHIPAPISDRAEDDRLPHPATGGAQEPSM
jgi:hypothetical protein